MDGSILLVPATAAAAPYTRLPDFDTAVGYTIINEALVPIKQSACGPRRPPGLVLLPKQVL